MNVRLSADRRHLVCLSLHRRSSDDGAGFPHTGYGSRGRTRSRAAAAVLQSPWLPQSLLDSQNSIPLRILSLYFAVLTCRSRFWLQLTILILFFDLMSHNSHFLSQNLEIFPIEF